MRFLENPLTYLRRASSVDLRGAQHDFSQFFFGPRIATRLSKVAPVTSSS